MFIWKKNGEFRYLEIEEFTKMGIQAYFTSRHGGVSQGCYATLNLGLHTRDEKESILTNRQIVAEKIGFKLADFVSAEQVHSDRIYVVEEKDRGRGALAYSDSLPGFDGIITATSGLPLLSFYADCVPLLFMDSVKRVVGLAHAGWKGTVKKIGIKTVQKMMDVFGSRPKDIWVGIGPSISRHNYQVDEIVIKQIRESFPYWRDLIVKQDKGHYLFDLWNANSLPLLDLGIPANQIIISGYCTYRDNDDFYSYRKENGFTGRLASIISL